MIDSAPSILWWIGLSVNLGYLGVVGTIMLYFERAYPRTWEAIGYPSMFFRSPTMFRIGNWLPLIAILAGLGGLFRKSWSLPKDDPVLTLSLWTTRSLFIAGALAQVAVTQRAIP